ncbi:MAG: hypothetical protein HYW57_03910 [Ignavibacteriales bacterium]|nr:hypothetical protein [Ignavibacteriales bacterium]
MSNNEGVSFISPPFVKGDSGGFALRSTVNSSGEKKKSHNLTNRFSDTTAKFTPSPDKGEGWGWGRSTMLVYATGDGVHGFTFDPSIDEFLAI